jgi:hypothetical protein
MTRDASWRSSRIPIRYSMSCSTIEAAFFAIAGDFDFFLAVVIEEK